jgi:hypothetical protein
MALMATLQVTVSAQIKVTGIVATTPRMMPMNVIPVLPATLATTTPQPRKRQRQSLAIVRTRHAIMTPLPANPTRHNIHSEESTTRRRYR